MDTRYAHEPQPPTLDLTPLSEGSFRNPDREIQPTVQGRLSEMPLDKNHKARSSTRPRSIKNSDALSAHLPSRYSFSGVFLVISPPRRHNNVTVNRSSDVYDEMATCVFSFAFNAALGGAARADCLPFHVDENFPHAAVMLYGCALGLRNRGGMHGL